MKKQLLTLALLTSFSGFITAQEECGTDIITNQLFEQHPELIQIREQADELIREYMLNPPAQKTNACTVYIIPVVWHNESVLYPMDAATAQMLLDEMTLYFRKRNPYYTNIVDQIYPSFKSIVADVQIEFKLAKKGPNGQPTDGVVIEDSFTAWNVDYDTYPQYYEIWNVQNPPYPGLAAFANYPGYGGPSAPGFTTSTTSTSTLAHETGHFLGLYHVFGNNNAAGNPNNCFNSDGVDDTPPTKGTTSCGKNVNTCNAGTAGDLPDNCQNIMDYAVSSRLMFTEGQKTRMYGSLNSHPSRKKLWTAANLAAAGVSSTPKYPCPIITDVNTINDNRQGFAMHIFPNPISEHATIQMISDVENIAEMEIVDIYGRTVYSKKEKLQEGVTQVTISVFKELADGVYVVRLKSGEKIITKKVTKNTAGL